MQKPFTECCAIVSVYSAFEELLLNILTSLDFSFSERDAFDTLFDHAPDKLNVVKKVGRFLFFKSLMCLSLCACGECVWIEYILGIICMHEIQLSLMLKQIYKFMIVMLLIIRIQQCELHFETQNNMQLSKPLAKRKSHKVYIEQNRNGGLSVLVPKKYPVYNCQGSDLECFGCCWI